MIRVELVGGPWDGHRFSWPSAAPVIETADRSIGGISTEPDRRAVSPNNPRTFRYVRTNRRNGRWRYVLEGSRDLW